MKSLLITVLCASALAPALFGQKLDGKDAPDFTMGGVINRYGPVEKSEMAGDVIVIKIWGPH
jgi:hypothetical protein